MKLTFPWYFAKWERRSESRIILPWHTYSEISSIVFSGFSPSPRRRLSQVGSKTTTSSLPWVSLKVFDHYHPYLEMSTIVFKQSWLSRKCIRLQPKTQSKALKEDESQIWFWTGTFMPEFVLWDLAKCRAGVLEIGYGPNNIRDRLTEASVLEHFLGNKPHWTQ